MIYAVTSEYFAKYLHHKAQADLEEKALRLVGVTSEEVQGRTWAELLGVEGDIAPKSLLRVEGSDGVIDVRGILIPEPDVFLAYFEVPQTSYRDLISSINEAAADANVERLVFNFDTPGGYVSGVEGAANAIANFEKPSVARVIDLAASAGYWLASQADTIEAVGGTASVGSIGVVVDTLDFSGWEDAVGIKSLHITNRESTDKRPDLSTEHGVSVLQDELDQIYEVFKSAVNEGRADKNGFTPKTVDDLSGRVVAAAKAEDLGLVDIIINNQQEADTMAKDGEEVTIVEDVVEPTAITEAEPVAATEPVEAADNTAAIDEAVAAERARISGLLALGGVQYSGDLTKAIEAGTTKADYAVAVLEAQQVKPEAAIDIPAIASAHKDEKEQPTAKGDKEIEAKISANVDTIVSRYKR